MMHWSTVRKMNYENTMYGTLGPERTVWDEEADESMKETVHKHEATEG